jgi:hypothetical protein
MVQPTTSVIYSYVDESGEPTSVQLNLPAILADGSNFDTVVSDVASSLALLGTALGTLTLCNEWQSAISMWRARIAKTAPSDQEAQREYVARFIYADDVTGKSYRFDVPGPDQGIFTAGTDQVNMADTAVAAFKIVFEANVKSEVGNAVTLVRGYRTTRRG